MPFKNVTRNLIVDSAVVRLVIRQEASNGNAKSERHEK
jgi:hypothetical protein